MTEKLDPFDDAPVDGIPRDRWDRPFLFPDPNGVHYQGPHENCKVCIKAKGEHVRHPYTRASSLASYIDNDIHIRRWQQRYLARGMGVHRDQAILAALETYNTSFGMPDRDPENSASGKRLDAIIEEVLGRMLIHQKADYGTAVHVATEPGFQGTVHEAIGDDVDSYVGICRSHGIDIVGTELFTANDETMSAGTFDNLKWVPGYGFVVTDKKTSSKVDGPHFAIQVSSYANGELVLPDESRAPLESLTGGAEINRSKGLIFWIKNGATEIHELDLELGYEGAQIAARSRDYSQAKHPGRVDGNIFLAAQGERDVLAGMISTADSIQELRDIWGRHSHLWSDSLTVAATARIAELSA